MKHQENIDLVKQFQSGNNQALSVLVKRWHKKFCEKAYWILKDKDLAKDIAQDSWKEIITKIEDLKEAKHFGGWAMRIVYSKSLDAIRNANKQKIKRQEYARVQTLGVDDIEENKKVKQTLLRAVKKLSYKQQVVIKLFYVEEYSLKQISDILNISVGTAKSRLFHAREQLKKQLKILDYEK